MGKDLRERGRQTMYRQTQGQSGFGAGSAYGATDWQALEVQLNRTRSILQEILVHLQEVLHNLKMARTGGRNAAGAEAGRNGGHDAWRRSASGPRPFASRPHQGAGASQAGSQGAGSGRTFSHGAAAGGNGKAHTAGATGSERTRFWNRPGESARAGAGASFRASAGAERTAEDFRARQGATAGEKTRASENRSSRAGASYAGGATGQAQRERATGQTHRERPRTESTFRGATGAGTTGSQSDSSRRFSAGASTASGQAGATGASRAGARPSGAGFRMDEDRQSRARVAARRGGMNLKCAYEILCLDYPCSVDEIKIAYRHMARLYHPDLGGDEEAMKDVNVAYEMAMRFSAGPRRASAAWAV